MATSTTRINDSRAGVAAEPLLRFLIRIALALLTTLAKKRSIGPQRQSENSTSYTTRHEYQEGLWLVDQCAVSALTRHEPITRLYKRILSRQELRFSPRPQQPSPHDEGRRRRTDQLSPDEGNIVNERSHWWNAPLNIAKCWQS